MEAISLKIIFRISSARGNTSLESAVMLTKQVRWEIQQLGQRLQRAANAEELVRQRSAKALDKAQHALELKQIAQAIRKLLTRIEDAVPLINLAITASGATLSSSLPTSVSPSRLLQASTFLTAGDSQYSTSSAAYTQIGPTFVLSIYMLFAGHIRPQDEKDVRESTWKEVIHKAVVRLMRVSIDSLHTLPGEPKSEADTLSPRTRSANVDYFAGQLVPSTRTDEYAYQLVIVEDLEDDRVHTFEDDGPQPGSFGDIDLAGIWEAIPIHEISKIFYADTGKILNIGSEGETNSPVLLLKRDLNAIPPRRMTKLSGQSDCSDDDRESRTRVPQYPATHSHQNSKNTSYSDDHLHLSDDLTSHDFQSPGVTSANPWQLPADLDPEWIAFEVYTEAEDSDVENDEEPAQSRRSHTPSVSTLTSNLSHLNVSASSSPSQQEGSPISSSKPSAFAALPPIRTSLSLLETLLRLLSLQQFQQTPHLSIPDELLTFFLSESASTGAATNNVQERKRLREEARRRVGFDPYDESPIKRRGEDYQYRSNESGGGWDDEARDRFTEDRYSSPIGPVRYEDEGYDTRTTGLPSPNDQVLSTPPRAMSDAPAERWFGIQPLGSAMSISTGPSPSPVERPRTLLTRRSDGGRYKLRDTPPAAAAGRKGSPLARPGTGMTDEGLGTSPSAEEQKDRRAV